MPELPEAETVRRGVAAAFAGRRILAVEATGARSTRRHPSPADYAGRLAGRRLLAVDRRGKALVGRLDDGAAVAVHLGMSGQLRRAAPGDPTAPHTHVVWRFDGAADGDHARSELRFVDPRTFGQTWVGEPGPGGDLPELAHWGPDALTGLPTWRHLAVRLAGRRTRLKAALMDQVVVAGIGNLYADEVLFLARLDGAREAGGLSPAELRRLHAAIGEVLAAAVEARGSSLADLQYRDVEGRIGAYQERHAVYGREGLPCPRCGRPVVRASASGRSAFSCRRCQRPAVGVRGAATARR